MIQQCWQQTCGTGIRKQVGSSTSSGSVGAVHLFACPPQLLLLGIPRAAVPCRPKPYFIRYPSHPILLPSFRLMFGWRLVMGEHETTRAWMVLDI
jgi:hypothetical protein